MQRFFFFASSLLLGSALSARPAAAQESVPSLDLRGYRPSTDPHAGLYLEPATSPGTLDWNVGTYFSYAYRPIALRNSATDELAFTVLGHQLTGDVVFGIGLFERAALGLDLPFALYQQGDAPTNASKAVLGRTEIPAQALGDLAITGKLTLVKPTGGDLGGFALALHERFTVPTGSETSFLGEGAVTSSTRLLAEYRLIAIGVHASLGVKLRAEPERFACADLPAGPSDACPTRVGHELPYGLGLSFRPQILGIDKAGRWTVFLESRGHLPLAPIAPFENGRVAALELGLGARVALKDWSILAGVETGVMGGLGTGPLRATLSLGWAPRSHDIDDDGVDDDEDQCRELAEDRDGFQDEDGCPEGDNDDDGVPDNEDKCGTQKEDEDGVDDDDGCPEPDAPSDEHDEDPKENEAPPGNEPPKAIEAPKGNEAGGNAAPPPP